MYDHVVQISTTIQTVAFTAIHLYTTAKKYMNTSNKKYK